MNEITPVVHHGTQYNRKHNKRLRDEPHIDKSRPSEVWIDEGLAEAYHRIFDEAVAEYNMKQTRGDRKISNYLAAVQADKERRPVYELIVEVCPFTDPETNIQEQPPEENREFAKQALREYIDGWKQRNPNLELIGVYYHADEEKFPHLHVDYIPVAGTRQVYKRGMKIQAAEHRALEELGFLAKNGQLPIEQWEASERAVLDQICESRGWTVRHPIIEGIAEKRAHESTRNYKAKQAAKQFKEPEKKKTITGKIVIEEKDYDRVKAQAEAFVSNDNELNIAKTLKAENETRSSELNALSETLSEREKLVAQREKDADVNYLKEQVSELQAQNKRYIAYIDELESDLIDAAKRVASAEKEVQRRQSLVDRAVWALAGIANLLANSKSPILRRLGRFAEAVIAEIAPEQEHTVYKDAGIPDYVAEWAAEHDLNINDINK